MKKTHTYDEVVAASTSFFKGDGLAGSVFAKYALQNLEGEYLELTPDQMQGRLAAELTRIEDNYAKPLTYQEIYAKLTNWEHVAQGSPMSGIGNPYQIQSISNCYVIESPLDSYAGIMYTDQQQVQIMKRRGGVGHDLSNLRPKGMPTSNAAKTTDGIGLFMERFSNTTREVAQCIAKGQRVLTKLGLKAIEEVVPGEDSVWTKKGWVSVCDLIVSGVKPVVKVVSKNGYEIKTTLDHVFSVCKDGDASEARLRDISIGDLLTVIPGTAVRDGNYVKLIRTEYKAKRSAGGFRPNEISCPEDLKEGLAYVVGYSYGDGSVEKDRFGEPKNVDLACSNDWPKVKEILSAEIFSNFGIKARIRGGDGDLERITIGSKAACLFLQENSLLKQKSADIVFPVSVLRSPSSVQAAFVAGYFDADGYASGAKKGYVFASVCLAFLKEVQTVLLVNGISSKIHTENRSGVGWKDLYHLVVVGATAQKRFVAWVGDYSVKVKSSLFVSKYDCESTPFLPRKLGVKSNSHNFINGDQRMSAQSYLKVREEYGLDELLLTNRLQSIEDAGEEETFDLVLASEHLFWCEGFYVHNSGRRGALMMSISVHHPEVETFIKIKKDKKKVTGANITVRLTDEFMEAVISDVKYEQRFPIGLDAKRQISKDVSAKSVLRTLAEAAWDSAEPGAFFWDTVLKYSPADCYSDLGFRTISSNPCQPAWATVLTQQGIKTIGEIDVGSVIWSGTQWTTVVNKWSTGVKPINAYKTGAGTFYGTDAHRIVSNGVKIEIGQATSIDPAYGPNGIHPAPVPNAITSVEFLGEEEVFDIEVDDPAHTYWTGGLLASNCGELFLCALDSCRLYLVNLTKFVQNRFKPNASFDFEALERSAYIAQRIMDDIVDLELECIDRILAKVESDPEPANVKQTELDLWKEIRKKAVQGRRTGLGQTGLGDTIAYLGLKYGSDEAVEFTDQVYRHLAIGSYKASIDMAQERGAFPLWELEKERNHPFLQRILAELPAEYQAKYAKYGRRNIANLTTSPAGSVSCLTQTTSGIEPTIFLSYTRRRKVAPGPGVKVDFVDEIGDSWEEHKVYHLGHKAWMEETGETDETKSPYWGTTAEEVDPMAKLKMQAAAQKWVDHAISNTINLPKTATVEDVENIYLQAWKLGCKGVTVYRAGSRSGVLVKDGDQPAVQGIVETNAPKRPNVLECDLHRSRIKGEEYLIIVGLLNGKPYEVFAGLAQNIDIGHKVNKGVLTKMANAYKLTVGDETFDDVVSQFDNPNYGSFTRTLSTALRHGVPIKYLVEQLRKDKHSDLYSFSTIMARVFAKNYIKDGSKAGKSCPECKSSNINYIQGCPTCHDCGYSKCG